jgi:hypothetical protein
MYAIDVFIISGIGDAELSCSADFHFFEGADISFSEL